MTDLGSYPGATLADSSWKIAYADVFATLCQKGEFLKKYPGWTGYPTDYHTTDGSGHYDPNQVSVVKTEDGRQVMDVECKPGANRSNVSAAMYPRVAGAGSLGMRVEQRIRVVDGVKGWHLANLLWPKSERWPEDGEIDYYECGAASTNVSCFVHRQNGTSGSDQTVFNKTLDQGKWHVVCLEWKAGQSVKWFVDGQQVGSTMVARVPSTKMRLVLQIESSGTPLSTTHVQYDWIKVHFPA